MSETLRGERTEGKSIKTVGVRDRDTDNERERGVPLEQLSDKLITKWRRAQFIFGSPMLIVINWPNRWSYIFCSLYRARLLCAVCHTTRPPWFMIWPLIDGANDIFSLHYLEAGIFKRAFSQDGDEKEEDDERIDKVFNVNRFFNQKFSNLTVGVKCLILLESQKCTDALRRFR